MSHLTEKIRSILLIKLLSKALTTITPSYLAWPIVSVHAVTGLIYIVNFMEQIFFFLLHTSGIMWVSLCLAPTNTLRDGDKSLFCYHVSPNAA